MPNKILCPVCTSAENSNRHIFGKLKIKACSKCGLQFISPFLDQKKNDEIYTDNYFLGASNRIKGYENYELLESCLVREAKMKLGFIEKYTSGKRVLDVGAGTGVFALLAKQSGFNVSANDLSGFAVSKLKAKKIRCLPGPVEKLRFPKAEFDIVTAWDVLEHITNPRSALKVLNSAMEKGGYLFLTTPDHESLDARLLGKNWYGYKKAPEHPVFYGKRSLRYLLENNGFQLVEIRPWGFVRDINFMIKKIVTAFPFMKPLVLLMRVKSFMKISLFFPFTDSIIVAKKK